MSIFDELVMTSQAQDLKLEEERINREKAEKAAWLAKVKHPGTYNATELLRKLAGDTPVDPALAPPPAAPPKEERKFSDARFPPPPTASTK